MATRRNVQAEKPPTTQDEPAPSEPSQPQISPEMPPDVIFKLIAFSVAMVVCPISTYYLSLDRVFSGNSAYAGGCAAVMANVVLMGYIIVAWREDQNELAKEGKKDR